MNDPFGSMQNLIGMYQGFLQNPMQYMLQKRLNIPQNMMGNPNAIIQQMMNSGQLNQQQYNMAHRMAMQAKGNPMFQQMFKR